MSTLNDKIKVGLRWSVVRQLLLAVTGTAAVLAYRRILAPETVGQFTIAFVVYSGLLLLIQAPIRDAVVFFRENEAEYSSAGFWLLLIASTAGVIAVLFFARPLAAFYEFPQAAGLTRGMALAFWCQALAVVPAALLLRRFHFFQHELLLAGAEALFSVSVIILLLLDFGAWALVIPSILRSIFFGVGTWWASGFRPLRGVGRQFYLHILRYSRSIFGSQFLIYLNRNIDQAAVGRLGDSQLGLYGFGENQSSFVVIGVGVPVSQIALPALAAVQNDPKEFRRIYLEMLRLAASLGTPAQIGALVLAPLLILVFFGEQWLPATAAMQGYFVYRILQTLLEITDVAMSAAGRPDVKFKADLIQLPLFVAGTWFAIWFWGTITAVAWTLAAVRGLVGLLYFILSLPIAHTALSDLWRTLWPSSTAAVLMGLLIYGLPRLGIVPAADVATPFGRITLLFILLILIGVITYLPLLYLLDRSGTKEVALAVWHIVLPVPLRQRLAVWWRKIFSPTN